MSSTPVSWLSGVWSFGGWLFGGAGDTPPRPVRAKTTDSEVFAASPDQVDAADREIIAQIRSGDEAAFRHLWTQYVSRLVSFAARQVGSPELAADLVQDVFVALWYDRATLTPKIGLGAYLYRAVWHRAQNARRRIRRAEMHVQREVQQTRQESYSVKLQDGEAAIEIEETRAFIERLLNRMSPRVREIFLLSRDEGLSAPEIAMTLGISPQVVRNQLSLATRILAENLRSLRGEI